MSVASPPDSSTISDYIPATIAAADPGVLFMRKVWLMQFTLQLLHFLI